MIDHQTIESIQQKIKEKYGVDAVLGFHHWAKAYYGSYDRPYPDSVDCVNFGVYHEGGGKPSEMVMRWRDLNFDLATPCLTVFDDAWKTLNLIKDALMPVLAEVDSQDISPIEFCEKLESIGFKNLTKTTPD